MYKYRRLVVWINESLARSEHRTLNRLLVCSLVLLMLLPPSSAHCANLPSRSDCRLFITRDYAGGVRASLSLSALAMCAMRSTTRQL